MQTLLKLVYRYVFKQFNMDPFILRSSDCLPFSLTGLFVTFLYKYSNVFILIQCQILGNGLHIYCCLCSAPLTIFDCLVTSRLLNIIQFKYIKMATLYTSLYFTDLHWEYKISKAIDIQIPPTLQFSMLGYWHPRLLFSPNKEIHYVFM